MRKALIPMAGGLNYYLPKYLVPGTQWSAGTNVRFGSGYAEKVNGWEKFFAEAVTGSTYHLGSYNQLSGDTFLIIHTPSKVYRYTGGDTEPVDITDDDLAGSGTSPVVSTTSEDLYVFTNQIDPIKFWSGTSTVKNLPGASAGLTRAHSHAYTVNDFITVSSNNYICTTAGTSASSAPTFNTSSGATTTDGTVTWEHVGLSGLELGGAAIGSCACVVKYAGFLIALGTVEDGTDCPQRVRWSQWGNSYRWKNNADGSGQAGWLDLTDGSDAIIAAKQLGEYLVIYKEKSICVMTYVGGDSIFQVRTSRLVTGSVAAQAVLDIGGVHMFVGDDNIYLFDLVEPVPAGDNIKTEFFRLLSPGYKQNIRMFFDKQRHEAIIAFTSVNAAATNNDMALLYNTDTKAWGLRELPMSSFGSWLSTSAEQWDTDEGTWDEDETAWDDSKDEANAPISICGDSSGYLYTMTGSGKDGSDMTFSLTTGLLDLSTDTDKEPSLLKRLKRIQLLTSREGDYDLTVEVGTADNIDDDVTWDVSTTLEMSTGVTPWVDVDITGRYFCVRISNTLMGQPLRITGMVFFYEPRGSI